MQPKEDIRATLRSGACKLRAAGQGSFDCPNFLETPEELWDRAKSTGSVLSDLKVCSVRRLVGKSFAAVKRLA